jgi:hypothetical protein
VNEECGAGLLSGSVLMPTWSKSALLRFKALSW